MKVLLINPPTTNMITTNIPEVIEQGKGVIPPLGLLYVAGYLKANSSHQTEVLDLQLENLSDEDLTKYLLEKKPDIVGLTAITFMMIDTIALVKKIKKILPNCKVVLGGPHVNIYPNETLKISEIDFLVLGEGEMSFLELVDNIETPKKLLRVPGLIFRKSSGEIHRSPARELEQDLDRLPHPARELTDYSKYYSSLAKQNPTTSMFTSRGCPYKCIFCDRPHLGKSFRFRSSKNVVDEMEVIQKLGIKEIFIYDDTFTVDRKRVVDICEEILKRGLKIGWDIRARVNTVDHELLALMKKAGCSRIHYGVESGDDQILRNLKKGINVEMVKQAFKLTHKADIETAAYFMVGCPGERYEHIKKSVKLAQALKTDYVHISVLTPFPATEIYFIGLQNRLIKKDVWREFAKNPTTDFVPPVWEENFSRDELISILKDFYRQFYLRPGYILKRLSKLTSWSEFLNKAKVGLKILRV